MPRIEWDDGDAPPSSVLYAPIYRGPGLGRAPVKLWFLGDLNPKWVHWSSEQNTMPCIAGDCALCGNPASHPRRFQGFAPALKQSARLRAWVPVVVVFTESWTRKFRGKALRGLVFDCTQAKQGTITATRFERIRELDPPVPAFDVGPHLELTWFPHSEPSSLPEMPDPIPLGTPVVNQAARSNAIPETESTKPTTEQRAEYLLSALGKGLIDRLPDNFPWELLPGMVKRLPSDYPHHLLPDMPGTKSTPSSTAAPRLRIHASTRPADEPMTISAELEDLVSRKTTGEIVCEDLKPAMDAIKSRRKGGVA